MSDLSKYEKIINAPHHVSKDHPQMTRINRAAQFAPFAALTGYNEAIYETGREVKRKIELTEEEKEMISNKINYLLSLSLEERKVDITYFKKDHAKEGGEYLLVSDTLVKYDADKREIILESKKRIFIEDILKINNDNLSKIF